ncbi:metalloregulator ArsR/SmtB family transcription factor [Flexivirga sp. ID2601S]|uniref:Metalloregulator ArsR/SmtB family transcription factor n=1 Tax=Flexivirga aerilata TaxID=1656889 RepID=A0A849AIK9_9MICO|nr:metalloregulator ArsR/SmtB family transcription factor [Flexivirga aerilata]NNG39667.1 metalloregulator ArsR/SmtB family transcription factor [Flexivirga aerilata]
MDNAVLAALGEPNRRRIVELLAKGPRTVGDIASTLDLRQPQVTKHLQTLAGAGLVDLHTLGRRRICALRRGTFDEIASWATQLAMYDEDDHNLTRYREAIDSADASPVHLRRLVDATPERVWAAFTDPTLAALWWHPRHFTVASFHFGAKPGGRVALVLREADGAEHTATGKVAALHKPERLVFTMNPHGPDGEELFSASHDVGLTETASGTEIALTITVSDVRRGAGAALGGLGVGWSQLLDNLAARAAAGALEG